MRILSALALISSVGLLDVPAALASCHFPPSSARPSLPAYDTIKKVGKARDELRECMSAGQGAVAFAMASGVFCFKDLKAGTMSYRELSRAVISEFALKTPFAIYYNGKAFVGDTEGGIQFSKKEVCASGENASLKVKADNGTCRDFQNSTPDYKGNTPDNSYVEYLHLGQKATSDCLKKAAQKTAGNVSNPNGSVKASGKEKSSKKTKEKNVEIVEEKDGLRKGK